MMIVTHPKPSGMSKAFRSDLKWFRRNPHRTWRARPRIAGEENHRLDPPTALLRDWTITKRLASGAYARLFGKVPDGWTPWDTDENIAAMHAMWTDADGEFCIVDIPARGPLRDKIRAFAKGNLGASDEMLIAGVRALVGGMTAAEMLA